MEIILAVAIVMAVIFFGALISMGNERQRRAIDGLRDQIVLWALQDLQIKREKLSFEVRVAVPLAWLNQTTTKVTGSSMQLQIVEFFDSPAALLCSNGENGSKAIFSPLSPSDINKIKKQQKGRITRFANNNPLIALPRATGVIEISTLNAGFMFDLELPLAWKSLSRQEIVLPKLWLYLLN